MSPALFAPLMALLAIAIGTLTDAVIKAVALGGLSVLAISFWRFLLAGVVIAAAYGVSGRPRIPAATLRFHALRGLVHAGAAGLFFFALTQLPLAEATTLGFTAVLMTAPLERLILGQPFGKTALLAAVIGFGGVLIIALGGGSGAVAAGDGTVDPALGRISCLCSAFLYALSLVMLRARAQADGTFTIAVLANVMPALWLAGPALALTPVPSWEEFPQLAGVSLLGSSIWVLMTLAYARAPAQRLAPLEYSALIWSALLGWAMFGERPGPVLWLGAAVIIGACLLIMVEGRRARRQAAREAGQGS